MRVKGRLQLSTYRMRSHQLQVADEFLAHVKSLPLQYEKGIYYAFLEDYGTHYTKNGKSGGEYELVYVLNQDSIKAKSKAHPCLKHFQPHPIYFPLTFFSCHNSADLTERKIQECLQIGIEAELAVASSLEGNAHVKFGKCDDVTKKSQGCYPPLPVRPRNSASFDCDNIISGTQALML